MRRRNRVVFCSFIVNSESSEVTNNSNDGWEVRVFFVPLFLVAGQSEFVDVSVYFSIVGPVRRRPLVKMKASIGLDVECQTQRSRYGCACFGLSGSLERPSIDRGIVLTSMCFVFLYCGPSFGMGLPFGNHV